MCLGYEELSESHTRENLADALQVTLKEYNFEFDQGISISAATTDSGANIYSVIYNLIVHHVSCLGHSFNTSIQKFFSLEKVKPVIEKMKKIQNIFAYSWMAAKELSIEQERYGFKRTKFPSFSKTRWSILDLLNVVISQELPLSSFLRTHKKGLHKDKMLTENEIKIIKNILFVF